MRYLVRFGQYKVIGLICQTFSIR